MFGLVAVKHPKYSLILVLMFFVDLSRKCPVAIPMMSFDTAGKSDAEVMLLYGMREEESMSTYLTRTKGLIVLMAAVMQVGGPCILFSSLVFYQEVNSPTLLPFLGLLQNWMAFLLF